jgi:hypothetical protein
MRGKLLILSLAIAFSFLSCNKEDSSEFTDVPVIESYLEPGDFANVKISRQTPFSSNPEYSSDDLNDISINIIYNNKTYRLTSIGNGQYIDSSLTIIEEMQYELNFIYNSKKVSAWTKIPSKPLNFAQSATEISVERMDSTSGPPSGNTMPDPVELTWDNTDDSYYIVVIDNMEATLDPIRDFGDNAPPGNRFKKAPSNSSSSEIRAQEFQYYGKHRMILFHVLPDYASLYDQKNTSSQNLTNPSTNIVNGYGIFTGMDSDTLYIDVKEK